MTTTNVPAPEPVQKAGPVKPAPSKTSGTELGTEDKGAGGEELMRGKSNNGG